jgi:hypothetical protein
LSFLISFISYINVWDVRLCYSLDYIVWRNLFLDQHKTHRHVRVHESVYKYQLKDIMAFTFSLHSI